MHLRISTHGGCPTLLRRDSGTENVIMSAMRAYFRSTGQDELAGIKAH
jgi:hypothetical protein